MTREQLHDLIEQVKAEHGWDYDYIGIRTQDEAFAPGELAHRSHVWADGDDTGEELDGVSATDINSHCIRMHCDDVINGRYIGDHCAIIAGNSAQWGEDEGEIVISDPVVIHIIR